MKIKNSTSWDDNDLRKLFRKCVQEVEKVEQPPSLYRFKGRHKYFTLEVQNTDYYSMRGRATLKGYWILIKIPKRYSEKEMPTDIKEKLARLMIHEYYHTLGSKRQDRRNYKSDFTAKWEVPWVKDISIKEKQVIKKPKQDIKEKRYLQAVNNLEKAKTRKKRADTILKKWKKKVSYYEKKHNFKS